MIKLIVWNGREVFENYDILTKISQRRVYEIKNTVKKRWVMGIYEKGTGLIVFI
ncbi:hypothetical protein [Lacrimispora brassicae]